MQLTVVSTSSVNSLSPSRRQAMHRWWPRLLAYLLINWPKRVTDNLFTNNESDWCVAQELASQKWFWNFVVSWQHFKKWITRLTITSYCVWFLQHAVSRTKTVHVFCYFASSRISGLRKHTAFFNVTLYYQVQLQYIGAMLYKWARVCLCKILCKVVCVIENKIHIIFYDDRWVCMIKNILKCQSNPY